MAKKDTELFSATLNVNGLQYEFSGQSVKEMMANIPTKIFPLKTKAILVVKSPTKTGTYLLVPMAIRRIVNNIRFREIWANRIENGLKDK